MTQATIVDVCICTLNRESLHDTISSVAAQRLPDNVQLRIIVADNSADGARRSEIESRSSDLSVPITYVHAPAFNISIARNACLDAATGSHIAYIDDDEIADVDWIATLSDISSKYEIVFGVAQSVYDRASTPSWMVAGDFHSNRIGPRDAAWNGYTANVLIDRQFVTAHGLRFDPILGQTGGEDTLFFLGAHRAGARFGFSPAAIVTEAVDPSRAKFKWLIRRQFRSGQVHDLVLQQIGGRAVGVGLAIAKSAASLGLAILFVWSPRRRAKHGLRATFHAGVVAAAFGTPLYKEYAPAG